MWSVHFGLAAIAYVCVVVGWLYFPLRRNRDGSWAFSARQVLNGVWLVYRTFLTAWGTVEVLLFLVSGIVDPYARAIPPVVREHFTDFGREPFLGGREYVCWLVLVPLVFLSIAALSSLRLRRRYVAFLMRLAAKDSALSASAIAAMVSGGGGVGRALKTAAATFRVLPLASLTEADLTSNADTGLNEKVVAASLGECSCFMSHSWRDNGQAKWVLLHEWAEIHREIAKTEPTIWLDKACINQQAIDESLACLPVYLSACETLLVMAGPTYTSRLWCVIEMFTWFYVHGEAADAVIIAPLPCSLKPVAPVARAAPRSGRWRFLGALTPVGESVRSATRSSRFSAKSKRASTRARPTMVSAAEEPSFDGVVETPATSEMQASTSMPMWQRKSDAIYHAAALARASDEHEAQATPHLSSDVRGASLSVTRQQFASFTAEEASCYKASDRDHLLTVIESGFGSLEKFDAVVQTAFVSKVDIIEQSDGSDWLAHARYVVQKRQRVKEV